MARASESLMRGVPAGAAIATSPAAHPPTLLGECLMNARHVDLLMSVNVFAALGRESWHSNFGKGKEAMPP